MGALYERARGSAIWVAERAPLRCRQRHIRQHMTERPAIIMPAVPFASQADRTCALSVMRPIMTDGVEVRQINGITPDVLCFFRAICAI